jgi:hypothetical protein
MGCGRLFAPRRGTDVVFRQSGSFVAGRAQGEFMLDRGLIGAIVVAAALTTVAPTASAFEDEKYPDLNGQWIAVRIPGVTGQPAFDPTRPWGLGQQAPLTAEYQRVLEASLADQAAGGQGNWHTGAACLPPGMPAMMTLYRPMEIVVLPEITYILIDHAHDSHRRIHTDGRDWPADVEPSFLGYSIGTWIDGDGDGRFDVLEVETRHFKGPRALDPAGMPTHVDNRSIVKERIYFDKAAPALLHDEITLIDHALTRPWTVLKTYRRTPAAFPDWPEDNCATDNELIRIGRETYFRGADGGLLPTRMGQPPPDLRFFKSSRK